MKRKVAKKMRVHKVKARVGPAKKKPLARFEPGELAQLLEAERVLDEVRVQHSLMSRGFQSLWIQLRGKYGIVGEVDLDKKTGDVFQRPAAGKVH